MFMSDEEKFGKFFKEKRMALGFTLREFCRENGFDPGNISKLERGILPPPQGEEQRIRYAKALKIRTGSDDWLKFFDYAAAASGQVPYDIMNDERLLAKLPLLFRTVRGADLSREELEKMIDELREE
jgi:transcriptional regulator with XRE-family HTH domain